MSQSLKKQPKLRPLIFKDHPLFKDGPFSYELAGYRIQWMVDEEGNKVSVWERLKNPEEILAKVELTWIP